MFKTAHRSTGHKGIDDRLTTIEISLNKRLGNELSSHLMYHIRTALSVWGFHQYTKGIQSERHIQMDNEKGKFFTNEEIQANQELIESLTDKCSEQHLQIEKLEKHLNPKEII